MEPPASSTPPTSSTSTSSTPPTDDAASWTGPPPHRPGSIHDLRRSRHDRMLGGVAAGIAQSYGWDPTLVRLAFVVAAVFGIGIPVYVVAWIVIPPDTDDGPESGSREMGPLIGLILLGVGVLWLGGRLVPNGNLAEVIWPLTLIGGGIAVLVIRSGTAATPDASNDPNLSARAATESASGIASETDVATLTDALAAAEATAASGTIGVSAAPGTTAPASTSSAWAQPVSWPAQPQPRAPRPPRPRRPRSYLGALTVSVVAVFIGATALLASLDVFDVNVQVAGAIALGIVAVALVISAWFGRARGLVPLAILLTIALSAVTVIDTPIEGGIGDRDYRPTSRAQLGDEFRLGIGSMTLDLRDVPLPVGITDVVASVAIGELHVLVPTDVTVDVHAEAGIGRVAVFGVADGGTSVERDDTVRVTGGRVLRLDLRTGIGETNVERTPVGAAPPSESGGLR